MHPYGPRARRIRRGKNLVSDGGHELGLVRCQRPRTPAAVRHAACLAAREHPCGERSGEHAAQHEGGAAQRFAPGDVAGGGGHEPVRAAKGIESGSG